MRAGASWDEWRAEHGEPLAVTGDLAVWTDGSITIDVGDVERRPDAWVTASSAGSA
jgi:hypothetical protein